MTETVSTYSRRAGARMRAVRKARGMSLTGLQEASGGQFRAVVIGSYERGDRAVRMETLDCWAKLMGVPVRVLLPPADGEADELAPVVAAIAAGRAVRDLSRLGGAA